MAAVRSEVIVFMGISICVPCPRSRLRPCLACSDLVEDEVRHRCERISWRIAKTLFVRAECWAPRRHQSAANRGRQKSATRGTAVPRVAPIDAGSVGHLYI